MNNSANQEAIYNCFQNEDKNILINSVAGSGKTTTLMGIVEKCEYRTLFLAFNKSIQQEISEKIKDEGFSHAKALTLHSLGLMSVRTYYKPVINNNKKWDIINIFQKVHKGDLRRMSYKEKMHLIFSLMDMLDVYRIYMPTTFQGLLDSMMSMNKVVKDEHNKLEFYWNHVKEIYQELTFKARGEKIEIDFLDMIYIPTKHPEIEIPVKTYYLLIDECQDLNIVQHRMIDKFLAQGDVKKWVAAGDRNQSIYGFSGSFSHSFEYFENRDNVQSLTLDICYRSSKLIIEQANQVYDVMSPFKEDDGTVDTITDCSQIKDSSMIICRNTAPIVSLYFKLVGLGKRVYIKGEDILGPTVKFLRPFIQSSIDVVTKETIAKIKQVSEKKTDSERIQFFILSENLENFSTLVSSLGLKKSDKVRNLMDKIKEIMNKSKEVGSIEMSTIHKAKGLENDIVYILNEKLIPSPFATTPEQIKQENNLKYVARTRAKKELYYLNL